MSPKPPEPRGATDGTGSTLLLGAAVTLFAVAALKALLSTASPAALAVAETFAVVFVSIVVGALPFVLLGALVSGLLASFAPRGWTDTVAGLPLAAQLPLALAGSLAFPVCECASVPVARRLARLGAHPSAAVAFMLAAPVLNPVVLFSTATAYAGRGAFEMVLGRAAVGGAFALVAGLALGPLAGRFLSGNAMGRGDPAGHAHAGHAHAGDAPAHRGPTWAPFGRSFGLFAAVFGHASEDFLFMGRFVAAGAALAAAFKVLFPDPSTGLAGSEATAIPAMMGLAFLLSLCSEADAFVAASFAGFSAASQLAFLTFGPVLDLKLVLLYTAVFGRGFCLSLALTAVPGILAGCLLFGVVVG